MATKYSYASNDPGQDEAGNDNDSDSMIGYDILDPEEMVIATVATEGEAESLVSHLNRFD